jgi:hypothetical protein
MDTQAPENAEKIELIFKEVAGSKILEAYLESAPQFILQFSIILRTGNISNYFFKWFKALFMSIRFLSMIEN